ncbi:hypothetical protein EVAR_82583_1 [Eumeta japonica]|uniref:Uncharacterized protein n=1 Tax=Eumeta variegata TaxID=151549 RepID=A0A4C1UWI2_EUMVA|nr:hypothetical protein EVAR_82583_1 [Eumeta japonica]
MDDLDSRKVDRGTSEWSFEILEMGISDSGHDSGLRRNRNEVEIGNGIKIEIESLTEIANGSTNAIYIQACKATFDS